MQFNELPTVWEFLRKQPGCPPEMTAKGMYLGMAASLYQAWHRQPPGEMREAYAVESHRCQSEGILYELGRPYYKVWPGVSQMLSEVEVDLPCELLKSPHSTFEIRLAQQDLPVPGVEGFWVRSMLVTEAENAPEHPSGKPERHLVVWVDIGEVDETGAPSLVFTDLKLVPGTTINQQFEDAMLRGSTTAERGVAIGRELHQLSLRLAVSVCFLATGMDKIVQPDVLSKDLDKYIEAARHKDMPAQQTIVERARRRGKLGWHIGNGERLRPLYGTPSQASTGPRGPISHQYIRRAHFRRYESGQVAFVRSHTVRADLPATTQASGTEVR